MKRHLILILIFSLFPILVYSQSSVNAEDIIEKINNGVEVDYENVTIIGKLDFTAIEDVMEDKGKPWSGFPRLYICHVRIPVKFYNCLFKNDVVGHIHKDREEMYKAVFYDEVVFDGCKFTGEFSFRHSDFRKKACFKNTVFDGYADFRHVNFDESAVFTKSSFSDDMDFKHTEFNGDAYFEESLFEHDAVFRHTNFGGKIEFHKAIFKRTADFGHTDFPKGPDFSEVDFFRRADFKHANFKNGVDFSKAVFNSLADFGYTHFVEPVNFDEVEFNDDLDFCHSTIGGRSIVKYLFKKIKKEVLE